MGNIVESNIQLSDTLVWLRDTWFSTSGCLLRLFRNPIVPEPQTVLADFSEATYTGYVAQSTAGNFGSVYKVVEGKYQTDSGVFQFTCSGGSSENIYGWYLSKVVAGVTTVRMSGAFAAPITMAPGVAFTLSISAQAWALSIIGP